MSATDPTEPARVKPARAKPARAKLWGGRFGESTDAFVERFTASVDFDRRLYRQDIAGSLAHARMLHTIGVLDATELEQITAGLQGILTDIDNGQFQWSASLEDLHMNIEAALSERIGAVGGKLHTARSRNDQVATDLRLYVRDAIDALTARLRDLQLALIELAEREADTLMPGFTHLQTAQPISFGHHMLAWQEMLQRDRERLGDCRKRVNLSPLGAAALAGTSFPIDREATAAALGFAAPMRNSLDAVSDRDFAMELAACCSMIMVHLSRFSEELVLWSSTQFGFIELPDRFCTGSSIMPQKKNPDVPELVRGKCGRVIGDLVALLTLMKSQPLAYNRDNQEDKKPVFECLDTVGDCLRAFTLMMPAIRCRREAMRAAAERGFASATDLADYLVRKGLPFREAHAAVGKAVAHAEEAGLGLDELSLDTLRSFSPLMDEGALAALRLDSALAARSHIGGAAPAQVRHAATAARELLAE